MSNSSQARLLRIKVTPTWLTALDWEDYKYWIEGQTFGFLWVWWLLQDWHNWAHPLEGCWKLHCAVVPEKLAPTGFKTGDGPRPPMQVWFLHSWAVPSGPNWVAVVTGTDYSREGKGPLLPSGDLCSCLGQTGVERGLWPQSRLTRQACNTQSLCKTRETFRDPWKCSNCF